MHRAVGDLAQVRQVALRPLAQGHRLHQAALLGEDGDTHRRRSVLLKAEKLGRAAREIDDPVMREGAAVVDAHDQAPLVAEVLHLHKARHRQGAVGSGDGILIKDLAVGRILAVEVGPVPRGHADLLVVPILVRMVENAANRIGVADLVAPLLDCGRLRRRLGDRRRLGAGPQGEESTEEQPEGRKRDVRGRRVPHGRGGAAGQRCEA